MGVGGEVQRQFKMQEESLEKSACDHYYHLVMHCHFVSEIVKNSFGHYLEGNNVFEEGSKGGGLKQKLLSTSRLKSEFMETNFTSGSI